MGGGGQGHACMLYPPPPYIYSMPQSRWSADLLCYMCMLYIYVIKYVISMLYFTFSAHFKSNNNNLETQNGGVGVRLLVQVLEHRRFVKISNLRVLWIIVQIFEWIYVKNEIMMMETHFCFKFYLFFNEHQSRAFNAKSYTYRLHTTNSMSKIGVGAGDHGGTFCLWAIWKSYSKIYKINQIEEAKVECSSSFCTQFWQQKF